MLKPTVPNAEAASKTIFLNSKASVNVNKNIRVVKVKNNNLD